MVMKFAQKHALTGVVDGCVEGQKVVLKLLVWDVSSIILGCVERSLSSSFYSKSLMRNMILLTLCPIM